jgi:hypothetical protein
MARSEHSVPGTPQRTGPILSEQRSDGDKVCLTDPSEASQGFGRPEGFNIPICGLTSHDRIGDPAPHQREPEQAAVRPREQSAAFSRRDRWVGDFGQLPTANDEKCCKGT